MKYETYDCIKNTNDLNEFKFVSIGKCGSILKGAMFTPAEVPGIYNLAFGDINEFGEIDDYSISDNGDRNKVLATIVHIVERYPDRYPARWIYFTGSTEARTRLYRMAIGMNLEVLSEKFEIYGALGNGAGIFLFQKNLPVCAFYIKRKTSNFTL